MTIKKPSDGWSDFLGCIVAVIGVVALVIGTYALSGWVFMSLWNWLIVAIFPSVIHLNLWMGIGMVVFISWFKPSNSVK